MPENVIQIDEYGGLKFDRYYIDVNGERLIMITTSGKIKVVNYSVRNSKIVSLISVSGEMKSILYSKLLRYLKSE